MIDGEKIKIKEDTLLVGMVNDDSSLESDGMFYSKQIYVNTLQGDLGTSALATASPLVGVMGFLATIDFFSIGDDVDNSEMIIYKSTAVKSISFK